MVLPLVLVIIAVVAIGGTVTVLNWDKIVIRLKGKCLAVLGARTVGKTNLVQFLTTGSIPELYQQTLAGNPTAQRRFELKELDINIKQSLDVPGSTDAYREWRILFGKSDIVLYLLRADKLIAKDPDIESRTLNDMKHIGDWLEKKKKRPLFFIIGTHCDLDPSFNSLTPENIGEYQDKFCDLPSVRKLSRLGLNSGPISLILGSTKTIESIEKIVYEIFKQIQVQESQ